MKRRFQVISFTSNHGLGHETLEAAIEQATASARNSPSYSFAVVKAVATVTPPSPVVTTLDDAA